MVAALLAGLRLGANQQSEALAIVERVRTQRSARQRRIWERLGGTMADKKRPLGRPPAGIQRTSADRRPLDAILGGLWIGARGQSAAEKEWLSKLEAIWISGKPRWRKRSGFRREDG